MAENVVTINAEGEQKVHENVSGVELFTESGGTATFIHDAEILNPDWTQTDSTKKNYIRNKPKLTPVATEGTYASLKGKLFGDIETPLEEAVLEFANDNQIQEVYYHSIDNIPELYAGESYRVKWDGEEFVCTCIDGSEGIVGLPALSVHRYIGNNTIILNSGSLGYGIDTGEPFCFIRNEDGRGSIMTLDVSVSHAVSVTPVNKTKKLDKKYLPDDIGGGSAGTGLPEDYFTDVSVWKEKVPATNLTFEYNSFFDRFMGYTLTDEATYNEWHAYTGKVKVVWDGVSYVCELQRVQGLNAVGDARILGGTGNGEPFLVSIALDSTYTYWFGSTVDTEVKSHNVQLFLGDEEIEINDEYIPDPPEFDLAAMGLPALPLDGTQATVECDTAELRAALDKGLVKIKFTADMNETEVEVSGITSAMNIASDYQITFIGTMSGVPMLLNLTIMTTRIIGSIVMLATAATT